MTDEPSLTPRQLREAYLRNAAQARDAAARSRSHSEREHHLSVALFWTTLAKMTSSPKADD
jgi:hypothetical protein